VSACGCVCECVREWVFACVWVCVRVWICACVRVCEFVWVCVCHITAQGRRFAATRRFQSSRPFALLYHSLLYHSLLCYAACPLLHVSDVSRAVWLNAPVLQSVSQPQRSNCSVGYTNCLLAVGPTVLLDTQTVCLQSVQLFCWIHRLPACSRSNCSVGYTDCLLAVGPTVLLDTQTVCLQSVQLFCWIHRLSACSRSNCSAYIDRCLARLLVGYLTVLQRLCPTFCHSDICSKLGSRGSKKIVQLSVTTATR
jgi:hypothetical protein